MPPLSTPTPAARTLVLAAHPQMRHSRVNRALLHAAQNLATPANEGGDGPRSLAVCDLYALYPDYAIDVAAQQRLAQAAELIVWLHPVQWYSMPALMKLWVDEVLTHGWAYGPGGTALRGKYLWPVLSTGGPSEAYSPQGYNRHPFEAFMPPYTQTAALCGMHFIAPLVLHGAHSATEAGINAHAQRFAQRLASFPHWPADELAPPCPDCDVPARDRPA